MGCASSSINKTKPAQAPPTITLGNNSQGLNTDPNSDNHENPENPEVQKTYIMPELEDHTFQTVHVPEQNMNTLEMSLSQPGTLGNTLGDNQSGSQRDQRHKNTARPSDPNPTIEENQNESQNGLNRLIMPNELGLSEDDKERAKSRRDTPQLLINDRIPVDFGKTTKSEVIEENENEEDDENNPEMEN